MKTWFFKIMKAPEKLLENLKFSEIEIKYEESDLIKLAHYQEAEWEQWRSL